MTEPRRGLVAAAVAEELPGLGLLWIAVAARRGPSGPALRGRLAGLSDRMRGQDAVALRTRPVPRAYRTFTRQIGLDPDVERPAAEALALARLRDGGLVAGERIADACRVAVAETNVPVWALDGDRVAEPGPGITTRDGTLVVADPRTVHARLLGEPLPASSPGPRTRRVTLYAVTVAGVSDIHVEEALWQAAQALEGDESA